MLHFISKQLRSWILDLIFPAICLLCEEKCTGYLCERCWEFCTPIDPTLRCKHCFSELRDDFHCGFCKVNRSFMGKRAFVFDPLAPTQHILSLPKASACFAYLQWQRLDWTAPTLILPMPCPEAEAIGKELSLLMHLPFVKGLYLDLCCKDPQLMMHERILLFALEARDEDLQKVSDALYLVGAREVNILQMHY